MINNDLEVQDDNVSRFAVTEIINEEYDKDSMLDRVDALPSVTPQEPILDKLRAEIENINVWGMRYNPDTDRDIKPQIVGKVKEHIIEIVDKYKEESED